jgi:hypothetical protein
MNDDLISRQVVIKEIESLDFTMSKCLTKEECYGMNRAKEAVINCIRDLPKVQQKTGHWIEEAGDLRCSGCEFLITDEYYLGKGVACPNCGAKMEGDGE